MSNLARIVFVSLFFAVCALWYIGQVPVEMTSEQEMSVVAGAADSSEDCLEADGGCTPEPLSDADSIWLIDHCSNAQCVPCGKIVEWSEDATKNNTCQDVTYSFWNLSCGINPDHTCQISYNYCSGFYCNGVATKDGTDTATQCYW